MAETLARVDEFAQPARWRAFHDRDAEAKYRSWHRDRILPIVRLIAGGVACLYTLTPLSYLLAVGHPPRDLLLVCYAISVPICMTVLISSFTSLRRWANEIFTAGNVALSLAIIWFAHQSFPPASGAVACGMLIGIFYPIMLRVRTGTATLAAVILTVVPTVLIVDSQRRGDIPLGDAWFFLAAMLTAPILVVVASALIEAGMRRQFVAEQTIAHQQALLRRYVPGQVAEAVLSGTPDAVDRHERRKLTVFFSDLVGFTDLSEELEPEDLASVLHDYFTEMNSIAKRHGGTVDDLVGDAILVFFGAPERTDDHDQALRAVRMAFEMQEAMGPLNERWASAGIPETLTVRMGINTGVATVGNFGSEDRTKYTALGKQVNIAARIQSQCEPGKVLLGHATWLLVRDDIACTPKGELTLKGLHKPMPAYEVVGSQSG